MSTVHNVNCTNSGYRFSCTSSLSRFCKLATHCVFWLICWSWHFVTIEIYGGIFDFDVSVGCHFGRWRFRQLTCVLFQRVIVLLFLVTLISFAFVKLVPLANAHFILVFSFAIVNMRNVVGFTWTETMRNVFTTEMNVTISVFNDLQNIIRKQIVQCNSRN